MTQAEPRRGGRTLRARLALWIVLSTALSFAIFGVVAYLVVLFEERAEEQHGSVEDPIAEARTEVLTALAFAAPIGLALAAAGAYWLTRHALAPVDRVIQAAAAISTERLGDRLPVPDDDDELRALVTALNSLLARLERGHVALALFAADAAHELRTPLAVIASELEVALRRPRSVAEWEASAGTSLDEVRRLSRIVDALLRLARADAATPATGERVELAVLVERTIATLASAAAAAGVTLEGPSATGTEAAAVDGDPDALSSALANIVANAIRYTPRGGHVSAAIEPADARDDRVTLVVDDSGPGLASDELERIFAPFQRGSASTGSEASSTGLGLAIARRIVERHGGHLIAGCSPTGGARFTLELPRSRQP